MNETFPLLEVENTYQKRAAKRATIMITCSSMRRSFREVRPVSFCSPSVAEAVIVLEHPS